MYIGSVVDDKGILELIQACKAMKDVKYKLVIVGAALNANDVLTEYEMKVNLKCRNKEDSLITKLGYYSYCGSKLCEKRNDSNSDDSTEYHLY